MKRLKFGDKLVRVRDEPEPAPTRGPVPLVCVHGAGMSSVVYMDVVRRLSPARRVVAPDLPGHGQSDRWDECGALSIDGYRDAVGAICARLGVSRAVLMGHSMGAAIALRCALSWPERVAGLVLLNGATRLKVAPELLGLLDAELPQADGPATRVDGMPDGLARLSFSPQVLPDLRARWQAMLLAAPRDVILGDFRACDGFDVGEAAAGLRLPVLLVAGADDLLVPAKLAEKAAAKIPGARLEVYPRTGHFSHIEDPDRVLPAIEAFLRTVS